ncbi:MAG TPA: hypothetical protein PK573_10865 [Spirochaetota bacterium]|nr:hypothetical protein [Spirochaetota bacterium]HRZ29085.1 hypothetical protein [Spirochaetota bacterium]HSA15881.1 hypothetical protein [Spirochaetota bacterium]
MKKGIVLMLAMAVMALTVACDDGSSEKEKKIRMAIHNKTDYLVKVKGATVGSTNLVDLWDDTKTCGGTNGIIPLNPDDAYIFYNEADDDYTTVDLPAGRFTAWYSVVSDDGTTECDFGDSSLDDVIAPGFTGKEVQPTYDLEAGSTYLVVFDEAYSATDYHAIWLKVDDNWEGFRMTEVSE